MRQQRQAAAIAGADVVVGVVWGAVWRAGRSSTPLVLERDDSGGSWVQHAADAHPQRDDISETAGSEEEDG